MKLLAVFKKTLLNEVSEKVKNKLLDKWGGTTEDTPEEIIANIDVFENIKSGLPTDKRDIMRYSYDELKDALKSKSTNKLIGDIFDKFKKREKKIENSALKKYIKRFLEIESLLPTSKRDINNYKFLDLVKMIDDLYPKLIVKKLSEKFSKENTELTKDQILFYISSYLENLNEIPFETKKVDNMSFSEFEHLIDGLSAKQGPKETKTKDIKDIDLIYNQNNLKIFAPKTKDQCIRLKNGRSWCTSREGGGNMYYNYRLGHERTLYYVIDEDLSYDDLNFASVILVDPNGRKALADKSNSGKYAGSTNITWSEISQKIPKIAKLENLFEPKPLTKEEKELIKKVERASVGDNPMTSFSNPQEVEMWLEYNSPRLKDIQYFNLTPELKKKYIALGMDLSGDMIENSEPEVIRYYISKKLKTLKTTGLKNLSSSDITLLNTPMLKKLKEELKPLFMAQISDGTNSEKVIIHSLTGGGDAVGKFIALYGLDEIFNSLPENIKELQITNRDQEGLIINVPESIGNFKELKMILFDNCIDSIPDSICGLEKLRFIALMNNKNLTTVPECIKDLPNLFFLKLKGSTNVKVPPGILENSNDVGNLMFDFQDL